MPGTAPHAAKNVSRADAAIRILLGTLGVAVSLWWIDTIAIALPVAIAAVVLFATAITRECPLYSLLAIDTDHAGHVPSRSKH